MREWKCFVIIVGCLLASWVSVSGAEPVPSGDGHDLAQLFAERSRTVVYIEYYIQHEIDRQGVQGVGLVVTECGIITTLQNVFPDWVPVGQFRDIRLYPNGNPNGKGFLADYLGFDPVTGWHFLQIQDPDAAMAHLLPITDFAVGDVAVGQMIWGIGMTSQEMNYITYFRDARLSVSQPMPWMKGFATHELAVPGGPVFLADGRFVGRAGQALPRERDMWIGKDYFRANIRHPDESFMFLHAEPFLQQLQRILSQRSFEQRQAWIGIVGVEPLDRETAQFLGLENQGVIVISEILPDSPAQEGGLNDRDLVVAINGEPIPRFKPDVTIQTYLERQITLTGVGGEIMLTVRRGDVDQDVVLHPREVPMRLREARRQFFDSLGFTIREPVLNDSIQRRRDHREAAGVIVSFIRSNSAAASGNLRMGDWIAEIGGVEITDFEQAVTEVTRLADDTSVEEIVFLVGRMNDTAVIRVRKN